MAPVENVEQSHIDYSPETKSVFPMKYRQNG